MSTNNIKKKTIGAMGSISGGVSILGSMQVCHSLCMGIIVILGVIGITLTGMPLLFFTKIAVPIWIIAMILLSIIFYLYLKKPCISKNLLFFNSGLLIAGIPFKELQSFRIEFWVVGGLFAIIGIGLYVKERISNEKCEGCTTK